MPDPWLLENPIVAMDPLLHLPEDPEALEVLYRTDPDGFGRALDVAYRATPDSPILQVWRARLSYVAPRKTGPVGPGLPFVLTIALATAALVRLPELLLGAEWYYPRFAPTIVILGLCAYFWRRTGEPRLLAGGLGLTVVVATYLALLPADAQASPGQLVYSDSVTMALLHLPVVLWAFLGLVFTGTAWRDPEARIGFVRYNGELLILGVLVGLGGLVFSGLTVALFSLVAENIEELYFENVGLMGAVGVPVVATYLYDAVFHRRTGIPSVLARVFAPLFLVMSTVYLVVAFAGGQNPFLDREFLITCNGLLLVVLGITGFAIVERDPEAPTGLPDYVTIGLAGVTLLINAIALAAIVFRLASYGFTPNRVVVLGANLVIMVHLARICWTYLRVVRGQLRVADLRRVATSYLPVYGAWAAIVAFLLPLLFRFG